MAGARTMVVDRSSVFPADRQRVFSLLQQLSTLQRVAAPYASFEPLDGARELTWEPGASYAFRFRLFGAVPFGTHRIHVVRFSPDEGIYTHEGNERVPVWNHAIYLRELPDGRCAYTDRVEIGAGWKTPFVWAWAELFYAHRQRAWIRLLSS